MKPKFDIGDTVKHEGEVSEVLSYFVSKDGVRYTVSSKDFDPITKAVTEGVKHLSEEELEEKAEDE